MDYTIPSLAGGEVDPSASSKIDDKHRFRCRELKNFFITNNDSVSIRPSLTSPYLTNNVLDIRETQDRVVVFYQPKMIETVNWGNQLTDNLFMSQLRESSEIGETTPPNLFQLNYARSIGGFISLSWEREDISSLSTSAQQSLFYIISRRRDNTSPWEVIGISRDLNFIDATAGTGIGLQYSVQAGNYSAVSTRTDPLVIPTIQSSGFVEIKSLKVTHSVSTSFSATLSGVGTLSTSLSSMTRSQVQAQVNSKTFVLDVVKTVNDESNRLLTVNGSSFTVLGNINLVAQGGIPVQNVFKFSFTATITIPSTKLNLFRQNDSDTTFTEVRYQLYPGGLGISPDERVGATSGPVTLALPFAPNLTDLPEPFVVQLSNTRYRRKLNFSIGDETASQNDPNLTANKLYIPPVGYKFYVNQVKDPFEDLPFFYDKATKQQDGSYVVSDTLDGGANAFWYKLVSNINTANVGPLGPYPTGTDELDKLRGRLLFHIDGAITSNTPRTGPITVVPDDFFGDHYNGVINIGSHSHPDFLFPSIINTDFELGRYAREHLYNGDVPYYFDEKVVDVKFYLFLYPWTRKSTNETQAADLFTVKAQFNYILLGGSVDVTFPSTEAYISHYFSVPGVHWATVTHVTWSTREYTGTKKFSCKKALVRLAGPITIEPTDALELGKESLSFMQQNNVAGNESSFKASDYRNSYNYLKFGYLPQYQNYDIKSSDLSNISYTNTLDGMEPTSVTAVAPTTPLLAVTTESSNHRATATFTISGATASRLTYSVLFIHRNNGRIYRASGETTTVNGTFSATYDFTDEDIDYGQDLITCKIIAAFRQDGNSLPLVRETTGYRVSVTPTAARVLTATPTPQVEDLRITRSTTSNRQMRLYPTLKLKSAQYNSPYTIFYNYKSLNGLTTYEEGSLADYVQVKTWATRTSDEIDFDYITSDLSTPLPALEDSVLASWQPTSAGTPYTTVVTPEVNLHGINEFSDNFYAVQNVLITPISATSIFISLDAAPILSYAPVNNAFLHFEVQEIEVTTLNVVRTLQFLSPVGVPYRLFSVTPNRLYKARVWVTKENNPAGELLSNYAESNTAQTSALTGNESIRNEDLAVLMDSEDGSAVLDINLLTKYPGGLNSTIARPDGTPDATMQTFPDGYKYGLTLNNNVWVLDSYQKREDGALGDFIAEESYLFAIHAHKSGLVRKTTNESYVSFEDLVFDKWVGGSEDSPTIPATMAYGLTRPTEGTKARIAFKELNVPLNTLTDPVVIGVYKNYRFNNEDYSLVSPRELPEDQLPREDLDKTYLDFFSSRPTDCVQSSLRDLENFKLKSIDVINDFVRLNFSGLNYKWKKELFCENSFSLLPSISDLQSTRFLREIRSFSGTEGLPDYNSELPLIIIRLSAQIKRTDLLPMLTDTNSRFIQTADLAPTNWNTDNYKVLKLRDTTKLISDLGVKKKLRVGNYSYAPGNFYNGSVMDIYQSLSLFLNDHPEYGVPFGRIRPVITGKELDSTRLLLIPDFKIPGYDGVDFNGVGLFLSSDVKDASNADHIFNAPNQIGAYIDGPVVTKHPTTPNLITAEQGPYMKTQLEKNIDGSDTAFKDAGNGLAFGAPGVLLYKQSKNEELGENWELYKNNPRLAQFGHLQQDLNKAFTKEAVFITYDYTNPKVWRFFDEKNLLHFPHAEGDRYRFLTLAKESQRELRKSGLESDRPYLKTILDSMRWMQQSSQKTGPNYAYVQLPIGTTDIDDYATTYLKDAPQLIQTTLNDNKYKTDKISDSVELQGVAQARTQQGSSPFEMPSVVDSTVDRLNLPYTLVPTQYKLTNDNIFSVGARFGKEQGEDTFLSKPKIFERDPLIFSNPLYGYWEAVNNITTDTEVFYDSGISPKLIGDVNKYDTIDISFPGENGAKEKINGVFVQNERVVLFSTDTAVHYISNADATTVPFITNRASELGSQTNVVKTSSYYIGANGTQLIAFRDSEENRGFISTVLNEDKLDFGGLVVDKILSLYQKQRLLLLQMKENDQPSSRMYIIKLGEESEGASFYGMSHFDFPPELQGIRTMRRLGNTGRVALVFDNGSYTELDFTQTDGFEDRVLLETGEFKIIPYESRFTTTALRYPSNPEPTVKDMIRINSIAFGLSGVPNFHVTLKDISQFGLDVEVPIRQDPTPQHFDGLFTVDAFPPNAAAQPAVQVVHSANTPFRIASIIVSDNRGYS